MKKLCLGHGPEKSGYPRESFLVSFFRKGRISHGSLGFTGKGTFQILFGLAHEWNSFPFELSLNRQGKTVECGRLTLRPTQIRVLTAPGSMFNSNEHGPSASFILSLKIFLFQENISRG